MANPNPNPDPDPNPNQAFGRALYADLSLPGHEAEFFALYEITDRGSSWLGPLVAAAILQVSSDPGRIHSCRPKRA